MIYKFVDSACPLFLVSRHLSVRKMFACYIKITTCTFRNKPCEICTIYCLQTSKGISEKYLNYYAKKQNSDIQLNRNDTIDYYIHVNQVLTQNQSKYMNTKIYHVVLNLREKASIYGNFLIWLKYSLCMYVYT